MIEAILGDILAEIAQKVYSEEIQWAEVKPLLTTILIAAKRFDINVEELEYFLENV